jgi:hypothetical protein
MRLRPKNFAMLLIAVFLLPLLVRAAIYYAGERSGSWYDADWLSRFADFSGHRDGG